MEGDVSLATEGRFYVLACRGDGHGRLIGEDQRRLAVMMPGGDAQHAVATPQIDDTSGLRRAWQMLQQESCAYVELLAREQRCVIRQLQIRVLEGVTGWIGMGIWLESRVEVTV